MTAMPAENASASILIVDGDIVSRHVIADYLRHCDYNVVEAANTDEALIALGEPTLSIDVILCDVSALGSRSGFELASWVRSNNRSWRSGWPVVRRLPLKKLLNFARPGLI